MSENVKLGLVLAVLAALLLPVVIPEILARRNREKQKRTMADMRTIGTALEARASDRNAYVEDRDPRVASLNADATDFAKAHPLLFAELERELVPKYIRRLPRKDGWGNDFEFRVGAFRDGAAQSYAIRSLGSDGKPDKQRYDQRRISSFKEDLVYSLGNFIQYPPGSASQ